MTSIFKNRKLYFTCTDYTSIEELIHKIRSSSVKFKNYSVIYPFFDDVLSYKQLSVDEFNTKFRKFKTDNNLKNFGVRQEEYFLLRGYSEKEAIELVSIFQSKNSNKHTKESHAQKSITWHKNNHHCKQGRGRDFYRQRGLTEEQIEEKIRLRNERWLKSLQKAIEKDPSINKRKGKSFDELCQIHGCDKAREIIRSRLNCCISKPEKEIRLLYNLSEEWQSSFYIRDTLTNRAYIFDYVNHYTKEIIEFNGDFWHCNPKYYSREYIHPILHSTAEEIWNKDLVKKQVAERHGYSVLYIWEDDIKQKLKHQK